MLSTGGALTFLAAGSSQLNANASGNASQFNGGTITLSANSLVSSGLVLNANGSGSGNGGEVTVAIQAGNLVVGTGGNLSISAAAGGQYGNGGTVTVSAGGNLTVNGTATGDTTSAIDALAGSQNGNGAVISLSAGGNLLITGSLYADAGASSGNGGQITLASNSTSPFVVGQSGPNGVSGTLAADSPGLGNGGGISITNSGGITAGNSAVSLFDVSSGSGSGGSVILAASAGAITWNSSFGISASGGGIQGPDGAVPNGGTISLVSQTLVINGNVNLFLAVNGSGGGNGGSITITQSGLSQLMLGGDGGQLSLSAMSGPLASSQGTSGSAGSLNISTGGSIEIVEGSAVNVSARGPAGSGESFRFRLVYPVPPRQHPI